MPDFSDSPLELENNLQVATVKKLVRGWIDVFERFTTFVKTFKVISESSCKLQVAEMENLVGCHDLYHQVSIHFSRIH